MSIVLYEEEKEFNYIKEIEKYDQAMNALYKKFGIKNFDISIVRSVKEGDNIETTKHIRAIYTGKKDIQELHTFLLELFSNNKKAA